MKVENIELSIMSGVPVLSPIELRIFLEKEGHMRALRSLGEAKQRFGAFLILDFFLFPILTMLSAHVIWNMTKFTAGLFLFLCTASTIVGISRLVFAVLSWKSLTKLKEDTSSIMNDECEDISKLAGGCRISIILCVLLNLASLQFPFFMFFSLGMTFWQYCQLKKYHENQPY